MDHRFILFSSLATLGNFGISSLVRVACIIKESLNMPFHVVSTETKYNKRKIAHRFRYIKPYTALAFVLLLISLVYLYHHDININMSNSHNTYASSTLTSTSILTSKLPNVEESTFSSSTLESYISSIPKSIHQKAFTGAIVGDAASMPLHWIYDSHTLSNSIVSKDKEKCEFNSIPSCPYYSSKNFPGHYGLGQPSPYGEQFLAVCDIVVTKSKNKIIGGTETGTLQKDTESIHVGNVYASQFASWLNTYTGRKDSPSNIFQQNYKKGERYPNCGAKDDQAMSLYKSVTALVYDLDEKELEPLVRFHQNHHVALDSATFLFSFLKATAKFVTRTTTTQTGTSTTKTSSSSLKTIYESVKPNAPKSLKLHLEFLDQHLETPTSDFLIASQHHFEPHSSDKMAIACHNPQALLRVLHISLRAASYEDGIRINILVGGDNASTAIGIGALLGMYYGVPKEWIAQTIL